MRNKSVYILNLEGAYIYKEKVELGEYRTDRKKVDKNGKPTKQLRFTKDKLYSATMPYSLECIRAFDSYPNELQEEGDKYYTNLFINVNFDKHYKKDKKILKHRYKIREDLYVNGFVLDGVEYQFFKRGGSKARTASAIFVKKDMYKTLFQRCLLGLVFEENELCDLTSKNAYISLIMSGIIGTMDFKKEEILIIDDVMGKEINVKASVTQKDSNGEIIVRDYDDYKVVNNMTDGQVLIDESKFEEYDITKGKSVALLRNDFMKGAGFNTKLQRFWQENGVSKVYDMYRGWVNAKDIKLVITPSSCKFLKFANKFNSKKECYLHWWNNIDSIFGVVKTDHVGNYGYANRLSYQMINSLRLNYEEMLDIASDEIHYIKMLKNNWDGSNYNNLSSNQKKKVASLKNDMTYFMNYIGNNSLSESTGEMIGALLSVNSDFRFTKKFKEYKKHQIKNYIDDVRTGKIRIKNSIYSILFSCPYTMLQQTTQKDMVVDSISSGWEVYCPNFNNNQELCMIRNPQINAGNITHVINKYHEEYKWFNLSDFIVILNTYDVDVMNRLQGCDFDIDSALLIEQKTIVDKAKECMEKYYTPINAVKGEVELKKDNMLELAKLDNYLGGSTRTIGQIVNKSAICNAYMWDYISNNGDERFIKKLYDASSMLSSFSQIAIDMAKKSFLDKNGNRLSLLQEMQKINYWNIDGKTILDFELDEVFDENKNCYESVKKMVVPRFFNEIADNSYRIIRPMKCGMDYLQEILDNELGKTLGTKLLHEKELFVKSKEIGGRTANAKQIKKVYEILLKYYNKINWTRLKSTKESMSDKARYYICKNAKQECINDVREINLDDKTVYIILKKSLGALTETNTKFKELSMTALNILYLINPQQVLKCFKSNNTLNDKVLILDEDGGENIFGERYKIICKKDIISQNGNIF